MIHFDSDVVSKSIEAAKDIDDFMDAARDLQKIQNAENRALRFGDVATARRLDAELRGKYPIIDEMLAFANRIPSAPRTDSSNLQLPQEVNSLQQDYYGIICHVAMKKGIIQSIKQFIKSVD